MKKLIGYFFVLLFGIVSCKTDRNVVKSSVAIEFEQTNVLYAHLDNPIKIASSGCISSNIMVYTDNGSVVKESEGRFVIKPITDVRNATVLVKCEDELIRESSFRVKRIPNPVLGPSKDRSSHNLWVNREDLLLSNGLNFCFGNFEYDFSPIIVKFSLVYVEDNSVYTIASNGNKFTTEQKEVIKNFDSGTSFTIEDIRVKMQEGVRKISSVALTIR